MGEINRTNGPDKEKIISEVLEVFRSLDGNTVTEKMSDKADLIGTHLFDEPLIGFASAQDPLFDEYKRYGVIGPWFMKPEEWLPGAGTVMSMFLPFSDEVKKSNRESDTVPSDLWLIGRVEGQAFIQSFITAVRDRLQQDGASALVPLVDERFRAVKGGKGITGYDGIDEKTYGSNWSERHAAYAAGLGTFGLSKGLITRRGVAGRYCSVIFDTEVEPDERPYEGIYDYCSMCGACARRCPADAITLEHGKDHTICAPWLTHSGELYAPRFGCGKCQTKVPCESQIPVKKFRDML